MPAPNQPRGPVDLRDLGIGKLRADLDALKRSKVTIGWQGSSGASEHPETDGATVAEVAAWNEYGTSRAPARPALGTLFERHGAAFRDAVKAAVSDVIDRRASPAEALRRLGELGVLKLRETIADSRSWAEPLAASTVRRKGHDQPWIDTGTVEAAASYAVRRDGEVVDQGGER